MISSLRRSLIGPVEHRPIVPVPGLSPLNAAIHYNEPVLVRRFLDGGADPYAKITNPKLLNGKSSFELLELLKARDKRQARQAIRVELGTPRKR
ncbi:hypothetical protein [Pseudomonas sp. YJ42]|uniref:hypothetical protein n=1 Tax=Pseudomonas sp. YJ42 TaxID=3392115 RepID=UPI0039A14369